MAMDKHFYENEKRLAAFALLHGITSISVRFEGGGDSGQIERVDASCGAQPFDLDTPITVFMVDRSNRFNDETQAWETSTQITEMTPDLGDFLRDHVDDALNNVAVDWYNNEGGQGEWCWDPQSGVEFHIDVNYVERNTEHSENRILGKSEEETDNEEAA